MNHVSRWQQWPKPRLRVSVAVGPAPTVLRALYWRMLRGAAWCVATTVALLAHG